MYHSLAARLCAAGNSSRHVVSDDPGCMMVSSDKLACGQWTSYEGSLNCFDGHGAPGASDEAQFTAIPLEDCKRACLDTSGCQVIVVKSNLPGVLPGHLPHLVLPSPAGCARRLSRRNACVEVTAMICSPSPGLRYLSCGLPRKLHKPPIYPKIRSCSSGRSGGTTLAISFWPRSTPACSSAPVQNYR